MDFAEIALNAAFYLCALFAVGAACVVAFSQNIVRSAFSLLAVLTGVAGMFAIAQADFIAAAQLMIYVGGILVLILFAIMLTHRITDIKLSNPASNQGVAGLSAILVIAALSGVVFHYFQVPPTQAEYDFSAPEFVETANVDVDIPAPEVPDEGQDDGGEDGAAEEGAEKPEVQEPKGTPEEKKEFVIPRERTDTIRELASVEEGEDQAPGLTKKLGTMMMTDFLLPFEVLSMLLLAALIGAAYLSRKEIRGQEDTGGEG